jgi:hypothetical protein
VTATRDASEDAVFDAARAALGPMPDEMLILSAKSGAGVKAAEASRQWRLNTKRKADPWGLIGWDARGRLD